MKIIIVVILISINFSVLGVGDTVAWGPEYHYVVKATPLDFDKTIKNIVTMLEKECDTKDQKNEIFKTKEFLFTSFDYDNYGFVEFFCKKYPSIMFLNWRYRTFLFDDNDDAVDISLYLTVRQKQPCPEDKLNNLTDKIGTILVKDSAIKKVNKVVYLKY